MTEDVGTTKRKPLTPTQRLALFERKKGICCVCGLKICGKFIDEHWRALGLGGSNDLSNRDIAHPACADIKTRKQDIPAINKAKAQKKAALGIKREPRQEIKSRGFPAKERNTDRLPIPPRRIDAYGRRVT